LSPGGGGSTTSPPVSGCWYLGSQQLANAGLDNIYSAGEASPQVNLPDRFFNRSYKIGGVNGEAHKSGTIMFTINAWANKAQGGSFQASGQLQFVQSTKIWYRRAISDTEYSTWEQIPGALEYNNLLFVDPFIGQWPPKGATNPYLAQLYYKPPNQNIRSQIVRAFNKTDFDSPGLESDIEYAIVINGMQSQGGKEQKQNPMAWVTADDVHYPRCINWQGKNAALTSANTRAGATPGVAGSGSFKYEASAGSNDSVTIDSNFTQILYADNPYGDYVNNFYEDAGLTTVWSPPVSAQWINFSLVKSNFTSSLDTWYNSGVAYRLQWIAGFEDVGGIRLRPEDRAEAAILGFYTSPSSSVEPFPTGPGGGGFFKSATRLYTQQ
jgi:hypothetical protein